MKLKKTFIFVKVLIPMFMLMFTGSLAFAHNIWLNPENHFPQVGETVDIGIGWGHTYPANRVDQEMKQKNLAYIHVLDPEGTPVTPVMKTQTLYQLKIDKPGVYLVTTGIKPGIFTKTTKGRKWTDKRGVENPISCTSFSIEAKTIIVAGDNNKNLTAATGQELEVIPLSNPANLKTGEEFGFMVLFKGKPAPNVAVNATYAGYTDDEKPADVAPHKDKAGKKKHFPVSTVTDSQGKALVSLNKTGYWMIAISHKTPYPDPDICDQYMHNMAFTMEIK